MVNMIEIKNLSQSFEHGEEKLDVLANLDVRIKSGEFVAFFGPNGCGKTTFLYLISSIYEPTAGDIILGHHRGKEATVGFVFQDFSQSIFPWRTVYGNVEFGLEVQGMGKENRRRRVKELLEKLNLLGHENKYPYQLSGGLKQSTAIARALAYDPDIFILDEPFSALDYQTTRMMWLELLDIWKNLRKTTLFVSHSIDEAVFLADRVIVFSKRPAHIVGEVVIDLPRPRKLGMLQSKKFFTLRNKVLKYFEEGLA